MIEFQHDGIDERLKWRRLLCQDVQDFCISNLGSGRFPCRHHWNVTLGPSLLFDRAGLKSLAHAIANYTGSAKRLGFSLTLSAEAQRDYYSHNGVGQNGNIMLPVEARRQGHGDSEIDVLEVSLPELVTTINFPKALIPSGCNRTPLALLLPYWCAHDLLFANQIAILSAINAHVRHSPMSWLRALFARRRGPWRQRMPLYWKRIDPSAEIHPTAVVEGAVIGADCRVGAGCVVRYSVLGKDVHLHDGAKVEYSAVDDRSWLMHDLVLYRSVVETDVFLIHGPYQFSCFQHSSAAFATIMMDYRPDAKAITIMSPDGIRKYEGRFLGALLEENARVFGGTLTAPGITIPAGKDVFASADVVRGRDLIPSV